MINWVKTLLARSVPVTVGDLRNYFYGPPVMAGVSVSEEIALGQAAVFRAITLKSSTIASLDRYVCKETVDRGSVIQPRHPVTQLLKNPNDHQNANKFWRAFITSVECSGNAYAEIERATNGQAIGLHLLNWRSVRVLVDDDGDLVYEVYRTKGKSILSAADVLHVTGQSWDGLVGISPIMANRETLGLGMAADRHAASVFGNGAIPRGFLKVKGGTPNEDTKKTIRENWDLAHGGLKNANKIGFLTESIDFVSTNMTPEDCQLLETRAFSIEEVARIWGVPPNLLFSGKQSYNANQEANVQFYELGLLPTLDNLESEIDVKLLTLEERWAGYSVNHKVDALLRGVFQAQAKTWTSLKLAGMATSNEGRIRLGLPPIDGGDELQHPTNLQKASNGESKDDTEAEIEPADGKKPEEDNNRRTRQLVREALLDQIGRGLRREAKSFPKPDAHAAYLTDALAPAYRAYQEVFGLEVGVEDFAEKWVDHTFARDLDGVTAEDILALIEVA